MAKARETEIDIPGDPVAATRWAFARAKKLHNEKAQIGHDIRDLLKEAKGEGANVAAIRLASRLSRMTPEKRKAWEDVINDAAVHFGYSKLEVVDMPGKKSNRPHADKLERIVNLEKEKADKAADLRETYAAAKDAGIDVESVRLFVRMSSAKDSVEISDWFDQLDQTGKSLGIWDGSAQDLSEDDF